MNLADTPQFEDMRNDLLRLRRHADGFDGIPAVDLIPGQIELRTKQQKSSPLANSSIIDGHASELFAHVRLRKSFAMRRAVISTGWPLRIHSSRNAARARAPRLPVVAPAGA